MVETNNEQARYNMIEQQIRPAEVLDQRVLDVIAATPREDFVPGQYARLAFADVKIPLNHDQVMMTPILEARMLQALNIKPSDKILEIGTGSGYLTACLARLGNHVYSVDIYADFVESAKEKLKKHGIKNVDIEVGDASHGWDAHGPYDVITITGSLPVLPESFKSNLSIGGRLCAIVGDSPAMECLLITRVGESEWNQEGVMETVLPPLVNAPQPQRFVF
jgi:protein-L-isoaspartate(D-aspartate) O-methyltransferase